MANKRAYSLTAAAPAETDIVIFDGPDNVTYAEALKRTIANWRITFKQLQEAFTCPSGDGTTTTTGGTLFAYCSINETGIDNTPPVHISAKVSVNIGTITTYFSIGTDFSVATGHKGFIPCIIETAGGTREYTYAEITGVTPITLRVYTAFTSAGVYTVYLNGTIL